MDSAQTYSVDLEKSVQRALSWRLSYPSAFCATRSVNYLYSVLRCTVSGLSVQCTAHVVYCIASVVYCKCGVRYT